MGWCFFSVGGILLGTWHSVSLLIVLLPPWWPDTLHCPEYCTDKPSTKCILNFRWVYFQSKLVWYLTRELRTAALSSLLNKFMYHLLIPFLTAAAGLSYQHHSVFMVPQMCVLGDVLNMLKSTDASDLSKERTEPTSGMAATWFYEKCSHTLSCCTIPINRKSANTGVFFCVMGCHSFSLETTW